MKTLNLIALTLATITSFGSFAMEDGMSNSRSLRMFLGVHPSDSNTRSGNNDLRTALEKQQTSERAMMNLLARNEDIEKAAKVELDKQPIQGRSSHCDTFIAKTRYEAAPLHMRLRSLVSNGTKLSAEQLAVLNSNQQAVIQGWVDYANSTDMPSFTGRFFPSSCTLRSDGMTDEKAQRDIQGLKRILIRVEKYNVGA